MFTICFSYHFHAYEVQNADDPEYVVCQQTELFDHYVLSKYTVAGNDFVPTISLSHLIAQLGASFFSV